MIPLSILGTLLLLISPNVTIASSLYVFGLRQETQPQENPPTPPSPQTPQSSDQQKASGESAPAPQTPNAVSTPCSQSSQTGSAVKTDCEPRKSTAASSKKHHRTHKPDVPAGNAPSKTVIRNGGTAEPTVDLSSRVNQNQASHQLDETNQQLMTADANLKKIAGRQLSANQQDTVKQIRSYMEQARTAATGGDVQAAHNLAVKANLLSAELAGH